MSANTNKKFGRQIMRSMLWRRVLIVLKIFTLINFAYSKSNHAGGPVTWPRRANFQHHNANSHKRVVDEMSPQQLSLYNENFPNKIPPLRHTKYSKIDKVMCKHLNDCEDGAGGRRYEFTNSHENSNAAAAAAAASVSQYHFGANENLESKLRRSIKRHSQSLDVKSDESSAKESSMSKGADWVPTNGSPFQEADRRKQTADSELSPVSKTKIKELGTPAKVQQRFFEIYGKLPPTAINKEEERRAERLANEHYDKMRNETLCRIPTPMIVKVADIYPHPHKIYTPSCTKLFRCSEQSGCCSDVRRCRQYKTQNVTLYFKVYIRSREKTSINKIEALTFQNDTECRCSYGDNGMIGDSNILSSSSDTELQDESKYECNCPFPFSRRTMDDGSCTCDCFDEDIKCLKHKRGEVYFDFSEHNCIRSGQCKQPICEHGVYSHKLRRCPEYRDVRGHY